MSWGRSIELVTPRSTLPKDDERARLAGVYDASRAKKNPASSQPLEDRLRFISHRSKQILLIDVSHCSAAEVEKIFRTVPQVVIPRPLGSVLILTDFTGASFDPEAVRAMEEAAVFDKQHVRKSAWARREKFPQGFCEKLSSFSRREFPVFKTREEALAWLVKD
jgi:hypothetical protein